jgi:hypothetical protein
MATNLKEFFSVISKNIELGEDFDLNKIPEVELPETFNKDFHKQYLTPVSAKNNEDVAYHYRKKYLSTVDSRTKAGFLAIGGTEDTFNEIKASEPDSMKLIDLVLSEVAKLKSNTNAPSQDKAHEAYKVETAKQIAELLKGKASYEDNLKEAVKTANVQSNEKLRNVTISSILNGKSFNDSIKREDAILLTMNNISNSPYVLTLDENLKQKVYSKDEPENLALENGVEMTWDNVLDKYSLPYTKKNDQPVAPVVPVVVNAPLANAFSDADGKYIVGHHNYGK